MVLMVTGLRREEHKVGYMDDSVDRMVQRLRDCILRNGIIVILDRRHERCGRA